MQKFKQLTNPPITEVVCGFVFKPQPLSLMDFGVYREECKDRFPKTEIHPAIHDGQTMFQVGAIPQRAWLISEDKTRILQIQSDRFFLNWRKVEGKEYPRFSAQEDRRGLAADAFEEFEKFSEWAFQRTGNAIETTRFELSKIDVLRRGLHYEDFHALGKILSLAGIFSEIQDSDEPQLDLRFSEALENGHMKIHISVGSDSVRLETRCIFRPVDGLRDFEKANAKVNRVFFSLMKDTSIFEAKEV